MSIENPTLVKSQKFLLWFGLAVFLSGLALYTYLSFYNRYWADDWCYNADLRIKGFMETVRGYSYDVTYTPSRYSVTIFAGLLQVFRVAGVQWMTLLTIWFWIAGLVCLFYYSARLTGYQPTPPFILLISSIIVYFSIYLTPQLYQSLYWRTGMLTYTTPLVLTTWIFVLITRQASLEKSSVWETALAGLLALLAGGCSEAAALVLVSSLGIYILVAAIGLYHKQAWARKTLGIACVALVFACIATILLIVAPSTQIRKERYGEPTPLIQLPRLIFNYTYAFFVLSVKDYQHLLIVLISALIGFVLPFAHPQGRSFKIWQYVLLDVIIGLLAVLLVAASLTPSIYIEKGLPASRTLIVPRFIVVFAFVMAGWIGGLALRELFNARATQMIAALALLATLAFPFYTLTRVANLRPIYAQRTHAWDVRDAAIRAALDQGKERVTVEAIDGLPVGGIRDFDPAGKKGYWITQCAANFYGIKLNVVLP